MSSHLWTFLTYLHTLAGPSLMLLWPLYASVQAIETPSKVDDEQWLVYWILYSFLTLMEMLLKPILSWIPIWYDMKLVFVAWLVLPQLRGAAFIYNKFVREQLLIRRRRNSGTTSTGDDDHGISSRTNSSSSPNSKNPPPSLSPSKIKKRFLGLVHPKKGEQEVY